MTYAVIAILQWHGSDPKYHTTAIGVDHDNTIHCALSNNCCCLKLQRLISCCLDALGIPHQVHIIVNNTTPTHTHLF